MKSCFFPWFLGPAYMRGGTGRLPGRDDEWDPGLYTILLYLSSDVYMEAGRFSSRPGQAGSRFVQPGDHASNGTFSSM